MKTAISVPDDVFQAADRLAKRLAMSRSQLYAEAVEQYVADHALDQVTQCLDEVYADEAATVDPDLLRAQAASIPPEKW